MIKLYRLLLPFFLIMLLPTGASAQDFGLNFSAGAKKKIVKGLNIAAEFELRTQENTSEMERIALQLEMNYKIIDYLRVGFDYKFIDRYNPKSTTKKGNTVDSYWSPRNRVEAYLTGILPIGHLKLSLREMYQFTHRSSSTIKKWDEDGDRISNEVKKAKNNHKLRSRVQAEYDFKKIHLTPYINVELYNDLADKFSIDKVKLTVGAEYTLKKSHELDLFYRFTSGIKDSDDDFHMIGLGYMYKF